MRENGVRSGLARDGWRLCYCYRLLCLCHHKVQSPGLSLRPAAGCAAAAAARGRACRGGVRSALPPASRQVRWAWLSGRPKDSSSTSYATPHMGYAAAQFFVSVLLHGASVHNKCAPLHPPNLHLQPRVHTCRLLTPPGCPAHSLNAAPGAARLATGDCVGVYVGRVVTTDIAEEEVHDSVSGWVQPGGLLGFLCQCCAGMCTGQVVTIDFAEEVHDSVRRFRCRVRSSLVLPA